MNILEKPHNIEKRASEFGARIIKSCQFLECISPVNSTLGKQILCCGTSIGSNVEEARAAESRADYISKKDISLKEARESHSRLRLLAAAEVVSQALLQPILNEALELTRIIGAIVVSAKGNSKS